MLQTRLVFWTNFDLVFVYYTGNLNLNVAKMDIYKKIARSRSTHCKTY